MRVPFSVGEKTIPRLLVGFGVLLVISLGLEWLLSDGRPTKLAVGALVTVPFKLAIVGGGYWLSRSGYAPERCLRIAGWVAASVIGFLSINVALMQIVPPENPWVAFGWARWAITTGGAVGLLVGIVEARAIEREVVAEQATLEAEYLDAQREWLDYLNALLRHEVLNDANVINGYATLLLEDPEIPESARRRLRVIDHQSRELSNVVRDVRILLETLERGTEFEAIDLGSVLETEVANLRARSADVRVETEIPEGVFVRADDLLPRLFANLLANAVEHNDRRAPWVGVTVTVPDGTADETVHVRIADNGPGIPVDKLEHVFERDQDRRRDHGIGLYLVRRLVERYDGTIDVTETGPDGTTFAVELPLARVDAEPSTAAASTAAASIVTGDS